MSCVFSGEYLWLAATYLVFDVFSIYYDFCFSFNSHFFHISLSLFSCPTGNTIQKFNHLVLLRCLLRERQLQILFVHLYTMRWQASNLYKKWMFITVYTRASHLFQSWTRLIQPMHSTLKRTGYATRGRENGKWKQECWPFARQKGTGKRRYSCTHF